MALPYNEDNTVDYDALRTAIFSAVVASTTPNLSLSDVTIEYEASPVILGGIGMDVGAKWVDLKGDPGVENLYYYPAISKGEQKIRISYDGTETIYGTSAETTVTITERPEAPYTLKATPDAVTLAVGEDMEVDYDLLQDAIFSAVVDSSDVLTADNVTITYYTKAVTDVDAKYVSLEGEKGTLLTWPAISRHLRRRSEDPHLLCR